MPQIVYYHPGAGTETSKVAKWLGGAFGHGVLQDVVECYRFICDNYRVGDEIAIIGFSRGAFTARSVAGIVCALGFLNHAGIEQLPHIFRDYHNWPTWTNKSSFNEKIHLLGFTLENMERMEKLKHANERREAARDMMKGGLSREAAKSKAWNEHRREPWRGNKKEDMRKELENQKRGLFKAIVDGNEARVDNEIQRDKLYRDMLGQYGMCLVKHDKPVEGKVKVIGVWDTVGSLGIPKTPFGHGRGRGTQEIQLTSLEVHPNVEYALHAIALDEWRTAFRPTLWELRNNNTTKLRQVWFPGNHGNVGGGWEDQQIATIALAWMADRLTLLGVELSKREMKHIFYSVNPDVDVREWGMGIIRNPKDITTIPDRAYTWLALPYRKIMGRDTDFTTRKPGNYTRDGTNQVLENTKEFVHPSVRIRYLYGGLDLDDKNLWSCRALVQNGYRLNYDEDLRDKVDDWPAHVNQSTYVTVGGSVTSYYSAKPSEAPNLVHVEQPYDKELMQLPPVKYHWFWEHDLNETLSEEYIGIWERMFIEINNTLLLWQEPKGPGTKEQWALQRPSAVPEGYPQTHGFHDIASR